MQRSNFRRYPVFFHRTASLVSFVALLVLVVSSFGQVSARTAQLPDLPTDQAVVKLKHGAAIGTVLSRYNATLLGTIAESRLHFLQLPPGQTIDQLLPSLNSDSDLFYAEPNYYAEGAPGGGVILFRAHKAPLAEVILFRAHGDLTPTPPSGTEQWAWIKIALSNAQKISSGQGIIVAVLDTGLTPDHPLLNSSITAGYDFVGMTNDIYDRGNGIDDDGNGSVDEFVGHGTHVSGIIVTEAPGVQIMPIRVLNSDGVGTYWEVAAGIRYAVDHGARIINMSLAAPRLTPSLADALAYAASHGVIVVAAAGTGTGPNYPAAYSNPLAVIGVGATDPTDGIPWFSGGQAQDTDVYAPGADISSAYPYNGYALGSGTSMAAPIVSGEAALLMSRYPAWTSMEVTQRILSQTDPVAGRPQGRVNLSNALNTGLEADYSVGDFGSPNDNNIKPRIRLVNHTPEDIPLSELKIRYWYTIDSDQQQTFHCDHVTIPIACGGPTGTFIRLPDSSINRSDVSDTYLEVGFTGSSGNLAAGGQLDLYVRINKWDWSDYVETNDSSYGGSTTVYTPWDHITLYRNGSLVWGVEPTGGPYNGPPPSSTNTAASTATRTATIVPSTPSPTRTVTSPPVSPTRTRTPTRTPTKTRTPTPAAATNTATRTFTPTAIPPTPTRTATALATTVKVQYLPGTTAANTQAISPKLILVNTGSTGIALSELKVRYWFTVDGNKPQTYWCDFAAFGCGNISAQFVALPVARPGADYYLELSFAGGAGSLAPGANSNQIQSRFSKNDWSSYVQTGDYSFSSSITQFTDWNRITVYRNGVLVWGIEP
jgi:subtilisin family serine protease